MESATTNTLARTQWRIGTAGWPLPRLLHDRFPEEGSHLSRYARVLPATEINSSFHRPHRRATYERWGASVPIGFRFSVKLPKTITHERRLEAADLLLDEFLGAAAGLGPRLGCLLVQLPPSLDFSAPVAKRFLAALRARHQGDVALEPRHASWFAAACTSLLAGHRVARVAADPARVPEAAEPGGWDGLAYWRLHGSPRTYYSSYSEPAIAEVATQMRRAVHQAKPVWCIFDNTASSAATANALSMQAALAQ